MLLYVYLRFSVWEYCYLEVKWKRNYWLDPEVRFLSPNFRFLCCRCLQPSFPLESGERNGHLEGSVHLTFRRHLIWVEVNPTVASLAVKIAYCSWLGTLFLQVHWMPPASTLFVGSPIRSRLVVPLLHNTFTLRNSLKEITLRDFWAPLRTNGRKHCRWSLKGEINPIFLKFLPTRRFKVLYLLVNF